MTASWCSISVQTTALEVMSRMKQRKWVLEISIMGAMAKVTAPVCSGCCSIIFLLQAQVLQLSHGRLAIAISDYIRLAYQRIISMIESSKHSTLVTFSKRVKSPYTLQYLEFEERLKGKKKQRSSAMPPLNTRKSSESNPTENYLDLAHDLLANRSKLWFADNKENLFPSIDAEEAMLTIKQKISRIKNRSQQTHLHPRSQHSEQLPKPKPDPALSVEGGVRSRVQSEAIRSQGQPKQGSVVTFLQYKKSKRELSIRLRREGP